MRQLSVFLCVCLWIGCGGDNGAGGSGATGGIGGIGGVGGVGGSAGSGGVGGSGATGGTSGSGGVGGSIGFTVSITPSSASVCPGDCVELTASASNGVPAYHYSWDHDLDASAGPLEVCPTETTTYAVTASDESVDGEFSEQNDPVTTSVQVTVQAIDNCVDGGVPVDPTHPICSLRFVALANSWISSGGWQEGDELVVDSEGSTIIAGQFGGTVSVDGFTLTAPVGVNPASGFVAKMDSDCHLAWIKQYGGLGTTQAWLGPIAGDDQDNIYVGGQFQGSVDFGTGAVTSAFNTQSGVLMKLDTDGDTLWVRTYSALFNSVGVTTLEVDSQRRVTFGGFGASDTSLGGAPLGGLQGGNIPFIAQLDGAGAFLWSKAHGGGDLYTSIGVGPDDTIVLTGWGSVSVDFGSGPFQLTNQGSRYMAKLSHAGVQQWIRALETPNDEYWGWWGGGCDVDSVGDIVTTRENTRVDQDGALIFAGDTIEKYSARGEDLWEQTVLEQDYDDGYYNAVHADGANNVLHMSVFHSGAMFDGESLTARGETDVVLVKLNAAGETVWHTVVGSDGYDWPLGVGADDALRVIVAYVSNRSETQTDLTIAKYAP